MLLGCVEITIGVWFIVIGIHEHLFIDMLAGALYISASILKHMVAYKFTKFMSNVALIMSTMVAIASIFLIVALTIRFNENNIYVYIFNVVLAAVTLLTEGESMYILIWREGTATSENIESTSLQETRRNYDYGYDGNSDDLDFSSHTTISSSYLTHAVTAPSAAMECFPIALSATWSRRASAIYPSANLTTSEELPPRYEDIFEVTNL